MKILTLLSLWRHMVNILEWATCYLENSKLFLHEFIFIDFNSFKLKQKQKKSAA